MPDREDELRELLHRRAADIPVRKEPPPTLLRRARRRIALNATAALIVLAASVGGAATVVRLVHRSPHRAEIASGSSVASGGAQLPACQAKDMKAVIALEGSQGELVGSVTLTMKAKGSCTLEGTAAVAIRDGQGVLLQVSQMPGQPWWAQGPSTAPPGWPSVTLSSGDRARARVRWINWCIASERPQTWSLELPGGGGTIQVTDPKQSAPGCTDPSPSSPSTIEVGPFEPYAP